MLDKVTAREQNIIPFKGGKYRFIFCHSNGEAFHQERPYLWFRAFLKRHKLRYIRFHDLRHISATMMITQGIHAKLISSRLGHSDNGITMNLYGHALQAADRTSADKMNNVYNFKKYSSEA